MPAGFPALRAVVLDATNARTVAEFYRELLGYVYRTGDEAPPPGQPDPHGEDWLVLRDTAGEARLAVQRVAELPASTWPDPHVPQQLHLDLTVADVDELAAQRERALALGATMLLDRSTDPAEPLYVFADPAGHPFCIFVSPDHPR
jgi:catechol 2,3-dioxygenase-like lactoylglutathione lyase family enzyme